MTAGRPRLAHAGTLYSFAHQLYWDFRRLGEGAQSQWFDRNAYERLAITQASLIPTRRQNRAIRVVLQEEIQRGRVNLREQKEWLRQARESQRFVNAAMQRRLAAEAAIIVKKIPGEPEVLAALLTADTPERVREICQDAYVTIPIEIQPGVFREAEVPNWPLPYGSVLPLYLSQHAEAFIAAKQDPRYPKSQRASSRLKQLWFLSRALAGAIFDVRSRTAINLVGSTRPEEVFEESHAARAPRTRTKRQN